MDDKLIQRKKELTFSIDQDLSSYDFQGNSQFIPKKPLKKKSNFSTNIQNPETFLGPILVVVGGWSGSKAQSLRAGSIHDVQLLVHGSMATSYGEGRPTLLESHIA